MRRFAAAGVMAGVLLLSGFATLSGQEAPRATRGAAPQWEYKLVLLRDMHGEKGNEVERLKTAETAFNEQGRDGWEYAGTVTSAVLFKRAKR